MTVFNPRLFYDAVKTRLAAIGKQLGDNIAPADPVTPYLDLYDLERCSGCGQLGAYFLKLIVDRHASPLLVWCLRGEPGGPARRSSS